MNRTDLAEILRRLPADSRAIRTSTVWGGMLFQQEPATTFIHFESQKCSMPQPFDCDNSTSTPDGWYAWRIKVPSHPSERTVAWAVHSDPPVAAAICIGILDRIFADNEGKPSLWEDETLRLRQLEAFIDTWGARG